MFDWSIPKRPLREAVDGRSPSGFQAEEARRGVWHTSAAVTGPAWPGSAAPIRDGRQRRDCPTLGDRFGQRPERTVAIRGGAQRSRVGDQRKQIRLGRSSLVDDIRNRQDVPPVAGEHERLRELDRTDRAALPPKPACGSDAGRIDPPDRVFDDRLCDLHDQISIRIPSTMSHIDHAM